ncbi:MAG: ribosome association toxin RatA [Sodalis sp. Psp]|nr:ribosome association toxin RatA [Sodalis sp. Psp]MCR3757195.1 ribosome association toxin RatA [Sodalis sp. Ppy]
MLRIMRSALVPYSTEQMFALVNDISAYSNFIPGCTSRVIEKDDSGLIAEMNISQVGISKSFITRNIITENHGIVMCLVEGPFRSLSGDWRFIPLSDRTSTIEFHLDFEFKNKLIDMAFGHIFKNVANNIVMAFTCRAKEIYNAWYPGDLVEGEIYPSPHAAASVKKLGH